MKLELDDQARQLACFKNPVFMSESFIETVLDGYRERLGFVVGNSACDKDDTRQVTGTSDD